MTIEDVTALPFIATGAEALFRVAPVTGDATHGTSTMTTGPWLSDERGMPCRGALGVLMDDVTGYPTTARARAGHWSVTTELHLDFSRSPALDGSILRAESDVVAVDPNGGLASGRIVDESGRVVAIASARLRFVDAEMPTGSAPVDIIPARVNATSIIELLGAHHRRDNASAGLELEPSELLRNPLGNVHGGILLCASEIAGHSAVAPEAEFQTTSIAMAFVRPCPGNEPITFAPRVIYRGRTFTVVQIAGRNRSGKTCTTATVTCHRV
ncbi:MULTISPECIES: PaaI family thioesterase [unclassified Rhodococcus (in: high G+C Gram-positive bacteria)]|uniref:PaaI family thioesterase n=1 Tax=unclassified Rhodococcus (in: high G+C Gram-positive bacteria) TaxID=192944 RepID=UPI00163B2787|nr:MULTISPECIES: hotdog domain-containing protein [unclassified Rhodococcus (in: high G+C Gram-positive bacteria)]MBC2642115.1 thioesterase family protein [Rhodococcus sp. 3A]MBC2893143.1 thioesterase family protein [Rhodococcus sp. 4CII]